MTYKISNEAAADIERIWLYTSEFWSVEQADRYLSLILDEIEYLCTSPEAGLDCSRIRGGYFRAKVKSHFVFYRFDINRTELEVIRVLHQQMDIENHLRK